MRRWPGGWQRPGGPGCPVPLGSLAYLKVTFAAFDGTDHLGELVVARSAAAGIVQVFRRLYAVRYPIRSMRLVDDFGGSDDASMAADNTSGFNCRFVSGTTWFSQHAYGLAIDLNTVENPYVSGTLVSPPSGARFASRPRLPGVIHAGDGVVRAFASVGWSWGGSWSSPRDYQHFSSNGH